MNLFFLGRFKQILINFYYLSTKQIQFYHSSGRQIQFFSIFIINIIIGMNQHCQYMSLQIYERDLNRTIDRMFL